MKAIRGNKRLFISGFQSWQQQHPFLSPGLRTGSHQHTSLQSTIQMFTQNQDQTNPVSRAWSIWSVLHDSSDLLPPKFSPSALHLMRPAHRRSQVFHQLKLKEVPLSSPKQNEQIEVQDLPYSVQLVYLVFPQVHHDSFKSSPSVMSNITDHG